MRIAIPADMVGGWKEMLDARGISQQRAVIALMRWAMEQDPLVQLMIFGQAPERDRGELSRIVLERLAASTTKGKGKSRAG